jgi:hypothetical protein
MSFGNVIFPENLFFQGGLITVTNGSATVTGTINALNGTATVFLSAALEGDTLAIGSTRHYIKDIVSDTEVLLTEPWSGPSATNSAYTGARQPWHLADRALAYKFAKFLEGDASASATAVQARDEALQARADSINARDLAQAWASRPVGQDVSGVGTRSAFHWASTASTHATNAGLSATAAATAVSTGITDINAIKAAAVSETNAIKADAVSQTSAQRQLAADWAEKAVDTDVTTAGTRSAKHHATKAGESATAAAADKGTVAADKAIVVAAKDTATDKASLAQEWAEKPHGVAVTGTVEGRSAKHYAVESANSAAAAAAIVFAGTGTIDYGFLTDIPTDFADYGGLI